MRIRAELIPVVAGLALLSLAGCTASPSSSPSSTAPTSSSPSPSPAADLALPGNGSGACVDPAAGRALFTFPLTNTGAGDATLTGATGGRIAGLDLTGYWITRPGPVDDAIAVYDDPPAEGLLPGWTDRAEIDGATVSAGETVTVVVEVALTEGAERGGVSDIAIAWADAAGSGSVTVTGAFGFAPIGVTPTPCEVPTA